MEGRQSRRYFGRMPPLRILVTLKRQKPEGKNRVHRRGGTNDPQWWGSLKLLSRKGRRGGRRRGGRPVGGAEPEMTFYSASASAASAEEILRVQHVRVLPLTPGLKENMEVAKRVTKVQCKSQRGNEKKTCLRCAVCIFHVRNRGPIVQCKHCNVRR